MHTLEGLRPALGEVVSREFKSAENATSLSGAPDREHVVIRFATSFTNHKAAIETVTPIKDPDGTWRISGCFIK